MKLPSLAKKTIFLTMKLKIIVKSLTETIWIHVNVGKTRSNSDITEKGLCIFTFHKVNLTNTYMNFEVNGASNPRQAHPYSIEHNK